MCIFNTHILYITLVSFSAMAVTRTCLHRTHSREVRSFLALEMAARKVLSSVLLPASTFARLHFASLMPCTGSRQYIHICKYLPGINLKIMSLGVAFSDRGHVWEKLEVGCSSV
jgi:hypothetical protein